MLSREARVRVGCLHALPPTRARSLSTPQADPGGVDGASTGVTRAEGGDSRTPRLAGVGPRS